MASPMMLAKCHRGLHIFENIKAHIFTFNTHIINLNYVKYLYINSLKRNLPLHTYLRVHCDANGLLRCFYINDSFFPYNKRVHFMCFPLNKFRWKSTNYIRLLFVLFSIVCDLCTVNDDFMLRFQNKAYTCYGLNNHASLSIFKYPQHICVLLSVFIKK